LRASLLESSWQLEWISIPPQCDLEEWRAELWEQALVLSSQAASPPPPAGLASEVQACFSRTRLRLFAFVPGVEDLIADLKSRGLEVAIITNGHHEVQRAKVTACGASDHVRHIIVGGEEELNGGYQKPHASIFLKACTLTGCAPQEAIIVGDSLSADVQGGINAGLAATVWVNAGLEARPEGAPTPDFEVCSVLELPEVLHGLGVGCRVSR
jgi:N-acylneuraminate-9-phosphatase